MKRQTILMLLATALAAPVAAQTGEIYAIRGATIHTLAGADIMNGTVVLQDGRITAVGASVAIPAGAEVINASGLHVYPGLFDASTSLGLTEIGAVDVTNDARELGDYNPHLQAATAVHPASEHLPVTRANGITHALTAPSGSNGGLAGQAAVIHLDGWTIEEMLIEKSVGIVVQWPSVGGGGRGFGGFGGGQRPYSERLEQYQERVDQLKQWFQAARHYGQAIASGERTPRDLRLEALGPVVTGDLPLLFMANSDRDILNAIAFAEEEEVDFVIAGASEAWKIANVLAEKNVKVILGPTQSMPSGADEAYDEPYSNPGILHAAGVKFGFGTFNSSSSRVLPYEAAMAVGFGLPHDAALRAVTINNAEIFGLGDRLGTVEVGKIGNLIVTDGDPLNIQTRIVHLIVNGRPVSTDNKHRQLYERYRARN
jgi:imidazolonepropionase-like amidohydrolase